MKRIIALLALAAAGAFGQQSYNLTYVAPPPVQGVGGGISGTAGTTTACYWVVVNYVGGGIMPASPTCFTNVPNTLSSSNYVPLSWQAAAGVNVTYDVLKTTTSTPPAAGASVSLTTGLTTTSTTDQGGALSPYTIAAYTYSTGTGLLRINNRDYTYPTIECVGTNPQPCRAAVELPGTQSIGTDGCSHRKPNHSIHHRQYRRPVHHPRFSDSRSGGRDGYSGSNLCGLRKPDAYAGQRGNDHSPGGHGTDLQNLAFSDDFNGVCGNLHLDQYLGHSGYSDRCRCGCRCGAHRWNSG